MSTRRVDLRDQQALEQIVKDAGLTDILKRDCVQRLKGIRFLGTMRYVVPSAKLDHSRYDHTLAVVGLSNSIAGNLGLDPVLTRRTLLLALVHDIGHSAFSHGSEVFVRSRRPSLHEDHTARVCRALAAELEGRNRPDLAEEVRWVQRVLTASRQTLKGPADRVARMIVKSPLAADAIDGITRAALAIGLPHPDPAALVAGLRLENMELCIAPGYEGLFREFVDLEHKVYEEYVYSHRGLAAEAMLTRALELAFPNPRQLDEFLRLDDQGVEDRCLVVPESRELIQSAEAGDLLVSLEKLSPTLHARLTTALAGALGGRTGEPWERIPLERHIARSLGVAPSLIVAHSTIRKVFSPQQTLELETDCIPVSSLAARLSGSRYEEKVMIFVPSSITADEASRIPIPTKEEILPPARLTAASPRTAHRSTSRLLGAYETPDIVCEFLVRWAVRSANDSVLDPALGNGLFLHSAFRRLRQLGASAQEASSRLYGVETDWRKCELALSGFPSDAEFPPEHVLNRSFFSVAPPSLAPDPIPQVHAVIANPPYVGLRGVTGVDRERALQAAEEAGVDLQGHVSSWAPYILHATRFLRDDGRLAMVLPAELMMSHYGERIRSFLQRSFRRLTVILFERRAFGAQQDTMLLLAERTGEQEFRRVRLRDVGNLSQISDDGRGYGEKAPAFVDDRWTNLLANTEALEILRSLEERQLVQRLSDIATTKIGIVTGANGFFLLSRNSARKLGIKSKWLVPIVARARHIPGAKHTLEDLGASVDGHSDSSQLLLRIPPDASVERDPALMSYLDYGERIGVSDGYKCRSRFPWYSVPVMPPPDALLTSMSGRRVRLVLNEARSVSTNTIHNLQFQQLPVPPGAAVAAFYTTLTALSLELAGHAYGGGMLKIDPGDCRLVLIPNLHALSADIIASVVDSLGDIDHALRTHDDGAFERLDELVLRDGLSLSADECRTMRNEAQRLQARRHGLARPAS